MFGMLSGTGTARTKVDLIEDGQSNNKSSDSGSFCTGLIEM